MPVTTLRCPNCQQDEDVDSFTMCDYCDTRVCEFCIKHLSKGDEGWDLCISCLEG